MSALQWPVTFGEYVKQNAAVLVRFGHSRFLDSGGQLGAVDITDRLLWRYLCRSSDPIFDRSPRAGPAVRNTAGTHNVVVLTQKNGDVDELEILRYDPADTRPIWHAVVAVPVDEADQAPAPSADGAETGVQA